MPYRRLPNTDLARLRAMKTAYQMGREIHPTALAFTQSTYTKLELFINSFETAVQQYREAYNRQAESSAIYIPIAPKARLYVSHFIQVVNMAVLRGELKPNVRTYYQLPVDEGKLPPLASDQEVIDWGQKIIQGEFQRTSEGRPPIMNPTIALVKVHYEKFVDLYTRHRILQQNTVRTRSELDALRETADQIILAIWDEVEEHFKGLTPEESRAKASQYGIIYVFRKSERSAMPESVSPSV